MSENILLCDMGGTHVRFARFIKNGEYSDFKKYRLNEFESFTDIIKRYTNETHQTFSQARFALARTPINGIILYKRFAGDPDFEINLNTIKSTFALNDVLFLNDLEAGARGVCVLTSNQINTVIPATMPQWNTHKITISVGTGVGHAGIIDDRILKTCGGHYLPVTVTDEHRRFEAFIRGKKNKNLSLIMEDFVSARGLRMVTEYISGQSNDALSPDSFMDHLKIYPAASRLFFEFLGLYAHNTISVMGAYGGVYLAGGVIDHLIKNDLADWTSFETYFRPPMLETVNVRLNGCPVHYVLHDELPLLGLTTY